MSEFLFGAAVAASVSSSFALWTIAARLTEIRGNISSVSHALYAMRAAREENSQ